MKILITGAGGQLAGDLAEILAGEHALTALDRRALDITDARVVGRRILDARPAVVFNCAAYHRVDECEDHPAVAFAVNAAAPAALARACHQARATLFHFSTDYVFDGKSTTPYREDDLPGPLSVYGASKLAGEHLVAALCKRHFVVRTSGLYGRRGTAAKGGSFLDRIARRWRSGAPLEIVDDQVCTPTFAPHLAAVLARMLDCDDYGTYHITNEGSCSWYEFARAWFDAAAIDAAIEPVRTTELEQPARRPAFSVLDKAKIAALGLGPLPSWQAALVEHAALLRR